MAPPLTFHSFPLLPPELRQQIWHHALPAATPALVTYKRGCWRPRSLAAPDPAYSPSPAANNRVLEFQHARLAPVAYDVPLALVSSEACRVVAAWAVARGARPAEPGVYARRFDAGRDVLFVLPGGWEDFLSECDGRVERLAFLGLGVGRVRAEVRFLAIYEAGWMRYEMLPAAGRLVQGFAGIEALVLVLGETKTRELGGGNESCETRRWEVARGSWEEVPDEVWKGEGGQGRISVFSMELARMLASHRGPDFKVWMVYADEVLKEPHLLPARFFRAWTEKRSRDLYEVGKGDSSARTVAGRWTDISRS